MSDQTKVKDQLDTVLMAFHLYKKDADRFKELCRKIGKFHLEVVRLFIQEFNDYEGTAFKFSCDYKPPTEADKFARKLLESVQKEKAAAKAAPLTL
jgi:hypothetical protein